MKIKALFAMLIAFVALGFSQPAHAYGAYAETDGFETGSWTPISMASTGLVDQSSTTFHYYGTHAARFTYWPGPTGQSMYLTRQYDVAHASLIAGYDKNGPRTCIISAYVYPANGFTGAFGVLDTATGTLLALRQLDFPAGTPWTFTNLKLVGTNCKDQLTVFIDAGYPASGYTDAWLDSVSVDWQYGI